MLLVTFDRPTSYMNQPTNKKETNFLDKIFLFLQICAEPRLYISSIFFSDLIIDFQKM